MKIMATRNRKVRRQRGSRTHGWGQITQHRHSGSRGGTGMAGLHKHKWSYTVKYAPDHFGHNQFRPPNRIITERWLNVRDLPRLILEDSKSSPEQPVDLGAQGFDKLLGGGNVQGPYHLKVPRASSTALEKIKAAGGSVLLETKLSTSSEESGPRKNGNSGNRQANK